MTKKEVKQFVVGVGTEADFSPAEIELLTMKLISWFRSDECDRNFDDPEQAAKDVVKQCLLGETKDGKPWANAPADFAKRIKVKAAYDMESGAGTPISPVKHPMAKRRLNREAEEGAKTVDQMNPILADFDPWEFRRQEEEHLLAKYPELDNAAHRPHVRRLTLLYAQQEMIDRELMLNPQPSRRETIMKEMKMLNETADSLLKLLDIHPESLRKKLSKTTEGTLGDLVSLLGEDHDFKSRERLWADQAALQFWYMTNHPNGRGDGPQLSEWEVWHMTRTLPMSFTCRCGQHYPVLLRGFTPRQLRDHLVSRGILVEVPAIPKLITEEDVEGINELIDSLPLDPE
jgi:hypothetical protein